MSIWMILLILIIIVHVGLHDVITEIGDFFKKIFKKNDI